MTAPGHIIPPATGWWVRSYRIGTGQGRYGWLFVPPITLGSAMGSYGWRTTTVAGGPTETGFPEAFPFTL